ncbi:MAG TPA: BCCT family transporter, partial [Candidatus Avipropionibacterium avicola]|nr:BCCT family transporter [Candidatus Avipropionibacterium avicola]
QQLNGAEHPIRPAEDVLFGVLDHLPLTGITSIMLMVLIAIFFITGADSASLVMGTMSQQGRTEPARWVTVTWGTLVGAIAAVLLVSDEAGRGLSSLQNATIVAALPFAVIMLFMMIAFLKDLRRDPLILRDHYVRTAVRHGVRAGLEQHGDDFALVPTQYDHSTDPHPWVEPPVDDELAETYKSATSDPPPDEDGPSTGSGA